MSEHEDDIVSWSAHQAALLERIARGEAPNETPNWRNIIDEVLDVGGSAAGAVESLLFRAMLHQLKLTAWPNAHAGEHWRSEVRAALAQAKRKYLNSMHRQISVPEIYDTALDALPEANDGLPPCDVPDACPYTLEGLFASVPTRKRS